MDNLDSIKGLFYERCFKLDYNTIVDMSEFHQSTELNNVIVGLSNECFGLIATTELDYKLFYVSGKELKGDLIELNIEEEFRDDLVLLFSQYLSSRYTNLEPISVFNNFQNYTRASKNRTLLCNTCLYFIYLNLNPLSLPPPTLSLKTLSPLSLYTQP